MHIIAPRLSRARCGIAAVLVVTGLAAGASAAPIVGLYKSDDLDAGVFLTGRWTEGFIGGNAQHTGNCLHAGSWDAATPTLFADWELDGPTLVSASPTDLRNPSGTGTILISRTFDTTGATLTLADDLPWAAAGDPDYTVALTTYTQLVTELYQQGTRVFVHAMQSFAGTFVGYPDHRLTGQANWALVGDGPAAPAHYPAWRPAGVTEGAWGDVGQVELAITPEPATLALAGAGLAGATWLRRRRRRP